MLEKALNARGVEASHLWTSPEDWGEIGSELDDWIASASQALAYAIVAASSVIDFEAAVVDGWMPQAVRRRLVDAIIAAIATIDGEGLKLPAVREGTVGIHGLFRRYTGSTGRCRIRNCRRPAPPLPPAPATA